MTRGGKRIEMGRMSGAMPARIENDEAGMRLAIRAALAGVAEGQSPFGCCIARDGEVLAVSGNRVWEEQDATAHAEVNAIRQASRRLGSFDLSGSTMYSTCEPCPMCYTAAHWARIARIVYGATIRDAAEAGFNELAIGAGKMKELSGDGVELVPGLLAEECRNAFRTWQRLGRGRPY